MPDTSKSSSNSNATSAKILQGINEIKHAPNLSALKNINEGNRLQKVNETGPANNTQQGHSLTTLNTDNNAVNQTALHNINTGNRLEELNAINTGPNSVVQHNVNEGNRLEELNAINWQPLAAGDGDGDGGDGNGGGSDGNVATGSNSSMPGLMGAPGSTYTMDGWSERMYLKQNPDVAKDVESGKIPSGLWHYNNYGRNEGRQGNFIPANFDEDSYLEANPDVAGSVNNPGGYSSGLQHYLQHGAAEGRNGDFAGAIEEKRLEEIIDNMIAKNDTDGNGLLTEEELGNKVWMQYSKKARDSGGGITKQEAIDLVKERAASGYHRSITQLGGGPSDIAINKLMGDSIRHAVYDVKDVEDKLGAKLPDWIARDGKVSETELSKFIHDHVEKGNLRYTNSGSIELTQNSSLLTEPHDGTVSIREAPVDPVSEPALQNESQSNSSSYEDLANERENETVHSRGGQIEPDQDQQPDNVVAGVADRESVGGQSHVRDTSDSGFKYPWSAAKSVGADDVPGTISKAVDFMNANEGTAYVYDKVKGTITRKDGGFISKDDVQSLNNIIVKYAKADFNVPGMDDALHRDLDTVSGLVVPSEDRLRNDPLLAKTVQHKDGAVRIEDNSSGLSSVDNLGAAGVAADPTGLGGLTGGK